jgi:hypothetical protein
MTIKIAPSQISFPGLPRGGVAPARAMHVLNESDEEHFINNVEVTGQFTATDAIGKTLDPFEYTADVLTSLVNTVDVCVSDVFIFVASTSLGVVTLGDSGGTLTQLSAFTPLTVASNSRVYYDGRFLYLANADGIHALKVDQFGALTLLDSVKPNAVQVLGISGNADGMALYVVDSVALTLLSVDNFGQFSVVSKNTTANGVAVAVLGDYSFVTGAARVYSVEKTNADNLILQSTYTGAAANLDNVTVIDSPTGARLGVLFATMINGANAEIIGGVIDNAGEFVYSGVKHTLAATADNGLLYDGALLHLFSNPSYDVLTVDLNNVELTSITRFATATKRGVFYDGEVTALVSTGLQAYSFGECRLRIDTKFHALGSGGIDGEIATDVFKTKKADHYLVAVARGGGAPLGKSMRSLDDGETWTEYDMPVFTDGYITVSEGNGVLIAVGYGSSDHVARSTDYGKTWTSILTSSGFWSDATYDNSVWIIVGQAGKMLRSTDEGLTWSSFTVAGSNNWIEVNGQDGVFVAVSWAGTNRIKYSVNGGVTWLSSVANTYLYSSVCPGGGAWVALTSDGHVSVSTDGAVNFTSYSLPENNPWYGLDYGAGRFAAVSTTGTHRAMYSANGGVSWTLTTAAEQNTWNELARSKDNSFVTVAGNGTHRVQRSLDNGETWATADAAAQRYWSGLCSGRFPEESCEIKTATSNVILKGACAIDDHVPLTSKHLIFDTRWDRLDRFKIRDIKDANRIPVQIKARLDVPQGAVIEIPTDAAPANDAAPAQEWRK